MSQPRIFLLTPYTGGNLGDQAILSCFVANLRQRRPASELVGLTLRPRVTATLHGIACFPLSAEVAREAGGPRLHRPSARPAATAAPAAAPLATSPQRQRKGPTRRGLLRRVSLLRAVAGLMRRVGRGLHFALEEVAFTPRAASLLGKGDLLIVAGGGQLDDEWGGPWAHPFVLWRWTLLARRRGCKIAVASVGCSGLPSRLSRFFIRGALARASYRSYRDPRSRATAQAAGFPATDRCVPDPALALPLPVKRLKSVARIPGAVGLSPMAYGRPGRWPTREPATYAVYLDALARFATALTEQDRPVILFTTSAMDRYAVADLLAAMEKLPGARLERVLARDTTTVEQLLPTLETCGTAVVSRLHGVLLAHRLSIPTLALSFHPKVEAHMHAAGQAEFCLDLRAATAPLLLEHFARLEGRAMEVRAQLGQFVADCEAPLCRQFDMLASLASRNP